MAHRGRNKKGRFTRGGGGRKRRATSVAGARSVNIRVATPRAASSGTAKRGRSGRYHGGKRSFASSLAKERGVLIAMSAGIGWLDASFARYAKLPPEMLAKTSGVGPQAANVIKQIPKIGPFGWKATVGGVAWLVHRQNRRNRWADRIATTFLQAEAYAYGYNQGSASGQGAIQGNGPAGGFIPAG